VTPELRFPDPPLADELVLLRPWQADDVPDKLMAFADPTIQRFMSATGLPATEDDVRAFFAQQKPARRRGEELQWAIVEPGDPAVVFGGCSLYGIDLQQGRAATGYWLAPAARGRGLVTHAVLLIARWAFDELGVMRLELTCGPDNERSQRVAERIGFTREGVLRSQMPFQGGRRDTVMFSLLPDELR
jgi:RimJ/RimL family protein N-acetyltransferase